MARGHRLNTSIVLAAVHGLSGLFRRYPRPSLHSFVLPPPPPPPHSPSLISSLASVDVKQNGRSASPSTPRQALAKDAGTTEHSISVSHADWEGSEWNTGHYRLSWREHLEWGWESVQYVFLITRQSANKSIEHLRNRSRQQGGLENKCNELVEFCACVDLNLGVCQCSVCGFCCGKHFCKPVPACCTWQTREAGLCGNQRKNCNKICCNAIMSFTEQLRVE